MNLTYEMLRTQYHWRALAIMQSKDLIPVTEKNLKAASKFLQKVGSTKHDIAYLHGAYRVNDKVFRPTEKGHVVSVSGIVYNFNLYGELVAIRDAMESTWTIKREQRGANLIIRNINDQTNEIDVERTYDELGRLIEESNCQEDYRVVYHSRPQDGVLKEKYYSRVNGRGHFNVVEGEELWSAVHASYITAIGFDAADPKPQARKIELW